MRPRTNLRWAHHTATGTPASDTAPLHEPKPDVPCRSPALRDAFSPLEALSRGNPFARLRHSYCLLLLPALLLGANRGPAGELASAAPTPSRKTAVSIVGDEFQINGRPTYAGRVWSGHKIQGLVLNSRMVQGIFDDRNPETVKNWAYPDTGTWDPERNTREFIAAMPEWRR